MNRGRFARGNIDGALLLRVYLVGHLRCFRCGYHADGGFPRGPLKLPVYPADNHPYQDEQIVIRTRTAA